MPIILKFFKVVLAVTLILFALFLANEYVAPFLYSSPTGKADLSYVQIVNSYPLTDLAKFFCEIKGGEYTVSFFTYGRGECSTTQSVDYDPFDDNRGGQIFEDIPIDLKPVIYLYPTKKTEVKVRIDPDVRLTVTYPQYKEGWQVTAYPNGKIINMENGHEHSYLFWEGFSGIAEDFDLSQGFVVSKENSEEFLKEKLSYIGLKPTEYNEFIVYWLPQMLKSEYNLVHFASNEEYGEKAKLYITPAPDSILRVFMVIKPLEASIQVSEQELPGFERTGFSVVEWGGTIIKSTN